MDGLARTGVAAVFRFTNPTAVSDYFLEVQTTTSLGGISQNGLEGWNFGSVFGDEDEMKHRSSFASIMYR